VTAFRCCDLVSNAQSNPNPHSFFPTVSSSFRVLLSSLSVALPTFYLPFP
jgi:hypothetical protein